jgi:poly-gamma-glutamate capsule biosynthesis protein CapA/YwtB (metallophosphatase superfamily)
MVNCEGALSDHGRQVGLNRTPERFALSMRNAGIDLVNLATNHTFDAEKRGFLDTLRTLSLAGIAHVGGGMDLADAREPVIVERNGTKLGFLGYTQPTTSQSLDLGLDMGGNKLRVKTLQLNQPWQKIHAELSELLIPQKSDNWPAAGSVDTRLR